MSNYFALKSWRGVAWRGVAWRGVAWRGVALSLFAASLLTACGGDGSTSVDVVDEVKTGVFIDAPVKGLGYQTATQQGKTNEKGEFKYKSGETVQFYLDTFNLGSAAGQAKVAVTLLASPLKMARLLQTLDIDAKAELIDVTGVKLSTALASNLASKTLDEVLTPTVIADLAKNSNVTFVHPTLVSESAAAEHVLGSVGAIPFKAEDFAGKVYADNQGKILVFNGNNTGKRYSGDYLAGTPQEDAMTWSIDASGSMNIILASPIVSHTFLASKLSQVDNKTAIYFKLSTAGANSLGFIDTLAAAKPITLAELNNKHFRLTDNSAVSDDCTEKTLSFSGNQVINRTVCGGQLKKFIGTVEIASGLANTLKVTFPETNKVAYYAVIEGSMTSGTLVGWDFRAGIFNGTGKGEVQQVSQPIADPS